MYSVSLSSVSYSFVRLMKPFTRVFHFVSYFELLITGFNSLCVIRSTILNGT